MKYTERARTPETQDPRKELMELYNKGDMPEHPSMFVGLIRKPVTHDSDVWGL